jgi:hypothetical protein
MGWGREEGRVEGKRGQGLVKKGDRGEGKRILYIRAVSCIGFPALGYLCMHLVNSKFNATKH